MVPSVQIVAQKWDAQFRELIAFGRTLGKDFVTPQFRLWLEAIIRLTPPKSKSQGTMAVRRDIYRAVQPFNVSDFRNKRLEEIVKKKDYAAFDAFARNIGGNDTLKNARAAPWDPRLHEDRRDRRGRVRSTAKPWFLLGRADRGALRRYIREKTDNVGIAASGWLRALHLLGGRESAFVERHGEGWGQVKDERANLTNPSVTAINRTPWARRKDEAQRIITNAQAGRVGAMRTHLRKLVEAAARKAGMAA